MPLGIENQTRNDLLTVGAASITVAVTRARQAIYFRNSSTGGQIITITAGSVRPAVAGYGIMLKPGEVFIDSSTAGITDEFGYRCFQGPYQAIADGAGGALSVFES